jgi:hypothetical protein
MTDPAGAEAWSYDPMGHILSDSRTTNGLSATFPYTYNLDGSVYTVGYYAPVTQLLKRSPTSKAVPGATSQPPERSMAPTPITRTTLITLQAVAYAHLEWQPSAR